MLGREKKLIEANYKIYYNDSDDSSHVLGVLYVIGRSGLTEAESWPSTVCHQSSRCLKSKLPFPFSTSLLPFWLWRYTCARLLILQREIQAFTRNCCVHQDSQHLLYHRCQQSRAEQGINTLSKPIAQRKNEIRSQTRCRNHCQSLWLKINVYREEWQGLLILVGQSKVSWGVMFGLKPGERQGTSRDEMMKKQ